MPPEPSHSAVAGPALAPARFGRTFQNEMKCSLSNCRYGGSPRLSKRPEPFDFGRSVNGAFLATMVVGMDDRTATLKADGLSFMRVIRGAEGSLVALGFVLAILLIGTPLALWARCGVRRSVLAGPVATREHWLLSKFSFSFQRPRDRHPGRRIHQTARRILQLAAQMSCPREPWPGTANTRLNPHEISRAA